METIFPWKPARNFIGCNLIFLLGLIVYLQLMREKTEGGQELEIILKDGVLDDLGSRIKYLIGVIHLERRYIAFLCIELCYVSSFFVSFTTIVQPYCPLVVRCFQRFIVSNFQWIFTISVL